MRHNTDTLDMSSSQSTPCQVQRDVYSIVHSIAQANDNECHRDKNTKNIVFQPESCILLNILDTLRIQTSFLQHSFSL